MQTKITLTVLFILASALTFSQNFEKQFIDLAANNDTAGQANLLTAWAAASPKDPELFIAYFNYYVRKSRTELVSLDKTKKNTESFVLSDTGTGETVGYLNASVHYKSDVLQKGFEYINVGISLYPARLDMRFGKIYMLGKAENYKAFTSEIVAAIDYGYKINHAWLWKESKPWENPKESFLRSLQDYVVTIYNTENDDLLSLIREISEAVIKYYPEHVESLSNIALTFIVEGVYDKALPYLLKAEQIAPKDVIVLNNIAEAYKRMGDKDNARNYYQKIIEYGNQEDADDAKQKIKEL